MKIQHWTPGKEEFLGGENMFAMQLNFSNSFLAIYYVNYDPSDPSKGTSTDCVAVFKLKKK